MVNINALVFLVSEASNEEEPLSDVIDDETQLAGENITLPITNTCVSLLASNVPWSQLHPNPKLADKKD